jgi:hypothetical protein
MNTEKAKLYDVRVSDSAEIAGAFLENKKTEDIRERVNPFDMVGVRINPEAPFAKEEEEATRNFLKLAESFPLVIWFSPPGGVYTEGRINIGRVIKNDNGEMKIKGKGIAVKWSGEKMLEVAKRVIERGGVPMDEFFDVEGLRKQPIGINLEEKKWIKKCMELMPELATVWEHINNGGDQRAKEEIIETVERILKKTGLNNIAFEREMAKEGHEIVGGNHGGTHLGEAGIIITRNDDGTFTYRLGNIDGMSLCPKCGCYYSGDVCPCIKRKI